MGNVWQTREALEIFSRHLGDKWYIDAEHDQILGPALRKAELTKEEQARLESLGWFIDDGCWTTFV